MSRLVDPVHFFDARGRSILSNDHILEQNQKLLAENKELREQLRKCLLRLKRERETEIPKAAKS